MGLKDGYPGRVHGWENIRQHHGADTVAVRHFDVVALVGRDDTAEFRPGVGVNEGDFVGFS